MLKNYVIVKHMEESGKFLFTLPKSIYLEAGDEVVCSTKYGNRIGICCCDSFLARPEKVMPLFGTCEENMKPVIGRVVYTQFQEAQEEEEEQEAKHAAEDG